MVERRINWDRRADVRPSSVRSSSSGSGDSSDKENNGGGVEDFVGVSYRASSTKSQEFLAFGGVKNESTLLIRCFKAIVSNCLNELLILRNFYQKDVEDVPLKIMDYKTIEERFGVSATTDFQDYRINMQYTDLHKLHQEVSSLANILSETISEMEGGGTSPTLFRFLEDAQNLTLDDNNLLSEVMDREVQLSNLRKKYAKEKTQNDSYLKEIEGEVQKVMAAREDQMVLSIAEISYVKKWEATRKEQNNTVLSCKENSHLNTSNSMKDNIDRENLCHQEIENFLDEIKADYLEGIEYWMETYDKELEITDNEVFNINVDIENITLKHKALTEEYEKRQKEMEDWLEYRAIKQERDERLALEMWAAIKIQAWWRGVMYRKKLGPYRKKKGRKGKDKDKKKKKK